MEINLCRFKNSILFSVTAVIFGLCPGLAAATLYEFSVTPEPLPYQRSGTGSVSYFRANTFNEYRGQHTGYGGNFALAMTGGTVKIDDVTRVIEFALTFVTTNAFGDARDSEPFVPVGTTGTIYSRRSANRIEVDPNNGSILVRNVDSFLGVFDFDNGESFALESTDMCNTRLCSLNGSFDYFAGPEGLGGRPASFGLGQIPGGGGDYRLTFGASGFSNVDGFWMDDAQLELRLTQVPEPASMVLLLSGAIPYVYRQRRSIHRAPMVTR